jgi:hypothetical protein
LHTRSAGKQEFATSSTGGGGGGSATARNLLNMETKNVSWTKIWILIIKREKDNNPLSQ